MNAAVNQKSIVFLSFSNDSKHVAFILTDGVDSKAVAYDWFHKSRVFGQMDFPKVILKRITFNPKDNHQVCTSGNGHWKLWRVQENTFKPMPPLMKNQQNHFYLEHAWLDDEKLVGCTAEGELFILENFEQKQHVENAFNSDEHLMHVSCLTPFSKGFFVASDNGYMGMWVRSDENNSTTAEHPYDFIRKWVVPATKGVRIVGMSVSPGEENLVVACKNNNIGIVQIKSIGLNEDQEKPIKFDLVCRGFHSGSISSIDVAIQRPIIVTCSKEDSTIRIWNYYTYTCELAREYYVMEDMAREMAKPLHSVAIHPSGYLLAASFIN